MTRGAWDGQGAAVTEDEAVGGPWAGLYEREDELAALSEALAEARAGTGGPCQARVPVVGLTASPSS